MRYKSRDQIEKEVSLVGGENEKSDELNYELNFYYIKLSGIPSGSKSIKTLSRQ